MAPTEEGLLDTSVFIALEPGRPLDVDRLPERSVICPVTLADLQAGVLVAGDLATRARRLRTLEAASDIEVREIGPEAAAEWARLRVHLAETGRRVNVNDLWIAAAASANGLPVVTQDDDFAALEGAAGVRVTRV